MFLFFLALTASSALFAAPAEAPSGQPSVAAIALAETVETVVDIDGNTYATVRIGGQVWTVENLRTTHFNDGTAIPEVADAANWKELTTPALCHYQNDPVRSRVSGHLYNWYAASSPKIAPKGWRVPTLAEQLALRDYLIAHGYNADGSTKGNKVAKALAAAVAWPYLENDAYGKPTPDIPTMVGNHPETNNRSGFSALPSGCRWSDGTFHAGDTSVYWWSTTPHADDHARHTSLHTWFARFGDNHHHRRTGFSIRLIRDNPAL